MAVAEGTRVYALERSFSAGYRFDRRARSTLFFLLPPTEPGLGPCRTVACRRCCLSVEDMVLLQSLVYDCCGTFQL
ncbi:hypothetical protein MRX96_008277 [Rhipicephalus microplus]